MITQRFFVLIHLFFFSPGTFTIKEWNDFAIRYQNILNSLSPSMVRWYRNLCVTWHVSAEAASPPATNDIRVPDNVMTSALASASNASGMIKISFVLPWPVVACHSVVSWSCAQDPACQLLKQSAIKSNRGKHPVQCSSHLTSSGDPLFPLIIHCSYNNTSSSMAIPAKHFHQLIPSSFSNWTRRSYKQQTKTQYWRHNQLLKICKLKGSSAAKILLKSAEKLCGHINCNSPLKLKWM